MERIGGKKGGICVRVAENERLQQTQGDCVESQAYVVDMFPKR